MGGSDSKIGLQGTPLKRGPAGTRSITEPHTQNWNGSTLDGLWKYCIVLNKGSEYTGNEYDFIIDSLTLLFFIT